MSPVTQYVLLDFAGRGLGQLTELETLGDLVPGQPLPRVLGQRVRIDVVLPERDEGDGHLAPAFVRHADDGALHDRGMAVEHLLDLYRGDVLSPGDDDVLAPVPDLDVAVGVHNGQVSGQEAAAAGDLPRRLVVAVVAEHDIVAVDRDLADRLAVGRRVPSFIVEDPQRAGDAVGRSLP